MFNGIVETIGIVEDIQTKNDCSHFILSSNKLFDDLKIDDSLSVNGVCLTITQIKNNKLAVTAVPETLRLTNLKFLSIGSQVNLERPMHVNSRISGHYMQGHVDGMGEIIDIQHEGDALLVKISTPPDLNKYIVKKGYITLDGMSITVIQAEKEFFTVTFIPHTQNITIVNQYSIGQKINIEVDILGKYVEKIVGAAYTC